MKMRKIIALLMAVVMLCGVLPFAALAEGETKSATIDFSTTDQRVSLDENVQVWSNEGLTLTNEKGTSTQPIKDYSNPVRLYANTTMKIEFASMTKLEIVTPTEKYATDLKASIEAEITGVTITYEALGASANENHLVTVTFPEAVDSISYVNLKQTRFRSIVAYAEGTTGGEEPAPEAPKEVTESLNITANTGVLADDESNIAWTSDNFTFTNEKAASSSAIRTSDTDHFRAYKGSKTTIAATNGMKISKVVVTATTEYYAEMLLTNTIPEGVTAAQEGAVVTFTFTAGTADALVIDADVKQWRLNKVEVTLTSGGSTTPETPETPAEPKEATIDFSTADQRVSQDDNAQVWSNDGLTVTNGIGTSTQPIKDYTNPVRIYAHTSLKIEFAGMTKLVINCSESKYVAPMVNTLAGIGGITVTDSGNAVTVVFAAATDVLDIADMAAQVRIKSITASTGGEGGETPDPEQPSKPTTPEEIVNAAYELGEGQALEGTYTLTGVITKVNTPFSDQYKNVTVTIVVNGMTDKPIQCFRLKGEGADIIGEGDTITVTGTLKNYYGTIEFDAGCNLDSYKRVPKTPEEIVNAAYELGEGQALEGTFTLTGVITAVNTPYSEQYKNVTVTIVVGDMTDKPIQCFRLKGDGADLIAAGDTITVTGTLKNYYGTVEFDAGCNLDSYTKAGEEGGEEVEPPVVPEYAVVDTPVAGTAYKFGMVQGNLDGRIFYLAGGMSSYYMSTTEDVTAAIDVYLEETEGGYYLYTMDGENKLYINMVVSGIHVNAKYEAAASTVYTYDADAKTVIAEIDGAPYWHGTRSDNTYTTVGPCKTEYNGFYCQFYAEAVEEEPENPGTGSELPETGDFALIAIGSLMVMSCAAVVLLKKKEF